MSKMSSLKKKMLLNNVRSWEIRSRKPLPMDLKRITFKISNKGSYYMTVDYLSLL